MNLQHAGSSWEENKAHTSDERTVSMTSSGNPALSTYIRIIQEPFIIIQITIKIATVNPVFEAMASITVPS